MLYYENRVDAVAAVAGLAVSLGQSWQSITITRQAKCGGYYVSTAIGTSSDDTAKKLAGTSFSETPASI